MHGSISKLAAEASYPGSKWGAFFRILGLFLFVGSLMAGN